MNTRQQIFQAIVEKAKSNPERLISFGDIRKSFPEQKGSYVSVFFNELKKKNLIEKTSKVGIWKLISEEFSQPAVKISQKKSEEEPQKDLPKNEQMEEKIGPNKLFLTSDEKCIFENLINIEFANNKSTNGKTRFCQENLEKMLESRKCSLKWQKLFEKLIPLGIIINISAKGEKGAIFELHEILYLDYVDYKKGLVEIIPANTSDITEKIDQYYIDYQRKIDNINNIESKILGTKEALEELKTKTKELEKELGRLREKLTKSGNISQIESFFEIIKSIKSLPKEDRERFFSQLIQGE